MFPRTNYEMTQGQLDKILDACNPTPVMFLSGGIPMGNSPQENANAAWAALGKEMRFDHNTVRPISGKGHRFFSAVPSETEVQRAERAERTKHLITPCPVCNAEDECPHTPVRCRHEWQYARGSKTDKKEPGDERTCIHCGWLQMARIEWDHVSHGSALPKDSKHG